MARNPAFSSVALLGGVAIAIIASICGAGPAISQGEAQDKNVTGQAVRPSDPKQAEPESQSHNAEKPKDKKQSEAVDKRKTKKN